MSGAPFPLASDAREALTRLDDLAPAMIARVQEWSAIPSGSANLAGLGVMAGALCDSFAVLPGPVVRQNLPDTDVVGADGALNPLSHGAALRVRVRPEAPIQVALTGHYDTVFAASSPSQSARFLDAERLNGPGVADMKGGLIVMREALLAFERTSGAKAVGYEVLISPDEEIGSPASAALLAEIGARAHVGMTYEPALPDGGLAGARKGSGNFALVVRGRSAHAGRAFREGRNAVVAAAEFALALEALTGVREETNFNVGMIDGGGPANVVPDRAVVRFNVRTLDAEGRAWAEAEIAKAAREVAERRDVATHLHGAFTRPPKPMSAAQAMVLGWTREAGADLGLAISWADTGGVCEGNNLFAAGCANVDTLGVRGGDIHGEQEYVLVSSFAERAKLSFILLQGFAAGRWDPRRLRA